MTDDQAQLGFDLPARGRDWPAADRFPYNFGGETVGARLVQDLVRAKDALIVTGYASLERVLALLHRARAERGGRRRIRVLLGVEPSLPGGSPSSVRLEPVQRQVADFWLEQGISLLQCGHVLSALALLDEGLLAVRTSGSARIHAKLYVTERAATVGSSNYTVPGLERNLEANARFQADSEPERHAEALRLGEALWSLGADFDAGFRELLKRLLRKVSWQEALARACAELVEGEWAGRFTAAAGDEAAPVWPAQEQGIAQAMWVLENVGSVLVADATGSGKTRLAAHLLRALQERSWSTGRGRSRLPVLVCPPFLGPAWRRELTLAGEAVSVFSHGVLSRRGSEYRPEVEAALRRTDVLTVDEAHNFLNRASQRSRMLYGNVADHVVLLTATPINRGARDLLAIVDLLGADNFDDEILEIVWRISRRGRTGARGGLSSTERDRIRGALQSFVVRRTKADFNRLVDQDPARYVNALGQPCRFPRHVAKVFKRDDPAADRSRAVAIREKAKNLRGLVNLQGHLKLPRFLKWEGWSEERFLRMRLGGARALAAYQVRSRLRSSKVALVEHLKGTSVAEERFHVPRGKIARSGDVIGTLHGLRKRPPASSLSVELPDWLADPAAHARAVDEEIATYEDILRQAESISDYRAEENARYLQSLLVERHERVLAFDSHLISLHDLARRLKALGVPEVVVATGEGGAAARRDFSRRFALGARGSGVVGLCSDALAEGMNLQGASAVVHLDLPSVIRILEQRVGRVDRMDSSFQEIEVHWPEEPPEFSLRADDRLLWRLQEVDDLLGSNVPVPGDFQLPATDEGEAVPVTEIIDAVETAGAEEIRVPLSDAFSEARALVEGPDALVPEDVYGALRTSSARVLSSVAVVRTGRPWMFLAVGASDRSVPQWAWVDLDGVDAKAPTPLRALDDVASMLRARLAASTDEDRPFDERAAELLASAIQELRRHERALLPRRKQRALEEMDRVLETYRKRARRDGDPDRLRVVEEILSLLSSRDDTAVDLGRLAGWWLSLVRPEWYRFLVERRGRRPAQLKAIRKRLREHPLDTERLRTIRDVVLEALPLERRVVAAIVGVG